MGFSPEYKDYDFQLARVLRVVGEDADLRAGFVAFPEGVILNYLTRTPSPCRYLAFGSLELNYYGDEAIIADLERQKPRNVLLLDRGDLIDWAGKFGSDPRNGLELVRWVEARYHRTARLGTRHYFVDVMKLGAAPSALKTSAP